MVHLQFNFYSRRYKRYHTISIGGSSLWLILGINQERPGGTDRWGTTNAFTLGWGAQSWNDGEWGKLNDVSFSVTGVSATFDIGSVSVSADINTGWGQDGWGSETYGESGMLVELTAPDAMQSNVSANAWNDASWGQGQGWGIFSLTVADVMGLTGVSSTPSVDHQQ